MILEFKDWTISTLAGPLGYQLDNDTRKLTLQGDLPPGWTWDVLVEAGDNSDIWLLTPTEDGASITLTDENLSIRGAYYLQVRGTRGSQVKHCNVVTAYVLRTLAGTADWPTLPTEFAQAEQNIKELNAHPPIPGENGYWLLWDLANSAYRESQLPVPVGPAGPANTLTIGTVETLAPGQPATAQITGEAPNQTLSLGIPQGQTGQTGATPALSMGQVETLEPGEPATAELTGTPEAPVLSLGIPQGQPGKDGVQLEDSAVTTTAAWSSKKIVDTLCPAFTVSGNPVVCNPVENYPLDVSLSFTPKQEGTGDPSPDNVRPITGYDSLSLTHSNNADATNTYDVSLPETVYGGTVDCVTGEGNETWYYKEFDGQENWGVLENELGSFFYFGETSAPLAQNVSDGVCSHFDVGTVSYTSNDLMIQPPYTIGRIWRVKYDAMGTADEFKAYLAAQYAAGTPVTIVYQLAASEPFEVSPQPVLALSGANTLYTDGDSLEVSGRRDLLSTLEDLQHTLTAVTNIISEGGLT